MKDHNIEDFADVVENKLGCSVANLLHIQGGIKVLGKITNLCQPRLYMKSGCKKGIIDGWYLVETKNFMYIKHTYKTGFGIAIDTYINPKSYRTYREECKKIYDSYNKDNIEKMPTLVIPQIVEDYIQTHIINFLDSIDICDKYNLSQNIGVILYGAPGNGKTSIANEIYKRVWVKNNTFQYYTVDRSHIEENEIPHNRCVLLFDDVDIRFLNRKEGGETANSLLRFLDGANKRLNQVRIFTTNESIDNVEAAFLRPGRIDRAIEIKNPTRELIAEYYNQMDEQVKAAIRPLEWELQVDGFSFAQLAAIYSFLLRAVFLHKSKPTVKDAIEYCNFNNKELVD
jgi:hypothetical protein